MHAKLRLCASMEHKVFVAGVTRDHKRTFATVCKVRWLRQEKPIVRMKRAPGRWTRERCKGRLSGSDKSLFPGCPGFTVRTAMVHCFCDHYRSGLWLACQSGLVCVGCGTCPEHGRGEEIREVVSVSQESYPCGVFLCAPWPGMRRLIFSCASIDRLLSPRSPRRGYLLTEGCAALLSRALCVDE